MMNTYDAVIEDINEELKRYEKKKLIKEVETSIHDGKSDRPCRALREGTLNKCSREEIIHLSPRSEKMIVEFIEGSSLKSSKRIVKCNWSDEISAS
jgi:hypothetical protein